VPEALAGRLARLIAHYADEAEASARTRERAQADLALLRGQLLELGRAAETAAALAVHLDDSLCVSYHSNDFAEAQAAKQALAVADALYATAGHVVTGAQSALDGIEPELPGLVTTDDF
jgi:tRNA isopentenyl-2-thiomethyl-A-37 hydroxylase MiaE